MLRTIVLRSCVTVGLLAAALPQIANAAPKVVLAEFNWDEPRVIDAVLAEVLRTRYHAEVSTISAEQTAVFAAMAKGDGSVDVHPAVWSGASQTLIDRYVTKDGTIRLSTHSYNATDGFYIPKFFAEAHNIKSIEDLKKPEIAKLFDVNGDGRGDYWPGAPGWYVANIYRVKAISYGLEKYYSPLVASDALLKSQLKTVEAKKTNGLLFYYWKPEALHQMYDLVRLEEPPFDGYAMDSKKGTPEYKADGCYKFIDPKDSPNWLKESKITCSSPAQPVYVGYSTSLEKRAPEIANFLHNVSIKADDVSAWIYSLTVDKKPADVVAKEWIAAHPDRIKEWTDK
jgi:glycine betaine/proline transport system substrate-binding protein